MRGATNDLLVFTTVSAKHPRAKRLREAGVEIAHLVSRGKARQPDLRAVLEELGRREIVSVMLEAGTRLNSAALGADIVDRVVIFRSTIISGRTGLPFATADVMRKKRLWNVNVCRFGPDICIEADLRNFFGRISRAKTPRRREP